MRLRTARKIADRVGGMPADGCSYDEMQLFRAFARLHRAWRACRVVTDDENGVRQSVTPDFFRENRVSDMLVRSRHFVRGRYRDEAPKNTDMRGWIERTWKPPQS